MSKSDPRLISLGSEFYDAVEPARFPDCIPRFLNRRWAERVRLDLSEKDWAAHFCHFEPLPDNLTEPLALRYHGHQFRVYNPEIGDGRGFTLRAAARRSGPSARSRHKGLRPNALQPSRRWPADAEGRYSRGACHGDARGAGRQYVEDFCFVRNRRGARARRRALAHPLVGPHAAQPWAHPHRHVPAPRLFRRGREHHEAGPILPRESVPISRRRPTMGRMRCGCSISSARRRRGLRRATWPPASSTACSTATISTSPAKASTMVHGASRLIGTRISLPLISTIMVSTPSAGSRRRSTGISRSWRDACRWSPDAPPLSDLLAGWSVRFRAGARRGHAWSPWRCGAERRAASSPQR